MRRVLRAGGLLVTDLSGDTGGGSGRERFYVTCDIQPSALRHLMRIQGEATVTSEILGIADDWSAWVLTFGTASMAHCAVLPLFGAVVAGLIERSAQGDASLIFTAAAEDDAAVESNLQVSRRELQLLQQHWRPRIRRAAPDRILQALDLLLSQTREPLSSLALVIADDQVSELAEYLPELRLH